jgi:hypothetical protein
VVDATKKKENYSGNLRWQIIETKRTGLLLLLLLLLLQP